VVLGGVLVVLIVSGFLVFAKVDGFGLLAASAYWEALQGLYKTWESRLALLIIRHPR
jgi:hypothetical protein